MEGMAVRASNDAAVVSGTHGVTDTGSAMRTDDLIVTYLSIAVTPDSIRADGSADAGETD